jgi:hypothetical protein
MQKCSTASVLVDLDDLDSGKPGWKSRVSFYPLVAAEISPAVLRTPYGDMYIHPNDDNIAQSRFAENSTEYSVPKPLLLTFSSRISQLNWNVPIAEILHSTP